MDIIDEIQKVIVKQAKDVNNRTHYYLDDGVEKRVIKIDNVQTRWMKELFKLIEYIAYERSNRNIFLTSREDFEVNPILQFFGLSESVADQLMYHLVKDCLSESDNNRNLDFLCYNILCFDYLDEDGGFNCNSQIDRAKFSKLRKYLCRLVMEEFNMFNMASFYDFYVSYWSCFESCITNISRKYENSIQEMCNDSNFKEILKYTKRVLSDLDNSEIILDKFIKSKELYTKSFPKYISFNDRYNYLFKKVICNYSRDIKQDCKILDFCLSFRNTIHNNGTHLKSDKEIAIGENIFILTKGEKLFTDDYSKIFILAKEIFDIYLAIYDGICTETFQ